MTPRKPSRSAALRKAERLRKLACRLAFTHQFGSTRFASSQWEAWLAGANWQRPQRSRRP